MTDFTRVQVGAVNNAGAADALFLKVFAGEVLTAFQNATVFDSKQRVRKIASGKSASFPATGRLGARYMVPGVTRSWSGHEPQRDGHHHRRPPHL
jgi:hypothetical protein